MITTHYYGRPAAPPATVTVLLTGRAVTLVQTLSTALTTQPWAKSVGPWTKAFAWRLIPATGTDDADAVDIAVCDGPSDARALRGRWPNASVIALVAVRDDGTETVANLHAGADVCIRGEDAGLIAAYCQSVARRRALLDNGARR